MLKNLDSKKITKKILNNKKDGFCLMLQSKYKKETRFYIDINKKNIDKYKQYNCFIYDDLIFILN